MTLAFPPPSHVIADGPASLQAWRRAAALRLGAGEDAAAHFGATGVVEIDGKPLSLQPLHDRPTGPWLASTRAARPEGIAEEAWCEALLLAASQSLLTTHAAFGLADDGDAVLILRIPPGHDHPDLLAAELSGLLALRQALHEGVVASATLPPAASTRAMDVPAETARTADPEVQEFEAPQELLALVHDAMLHLGRTPAQALAAARSGSLDIEGLTVGLACDADSATLVVAAELGAGVLDDAAQRRAALLANTELMAFAGVAVTRERRQARLMSRCRLAGQSAEHFAAWLRDFARLASTVAERRHAGANH